MVTTAPPPAYSGDEAPPPAYTSDQASPTSNATQKPAKPEGQVTYWIYWGVSFGTLLTWTFAVAAAADDAWLSSSAGYDMLGFEDSNWCNTTYNDEYDEICDYFKAGKAFQYMATILISIVLVLVVIAAFMQAPMTGKFGLAAGIILAVFAVFQLIAFACMAVLASKYDDYSAFYDVEPGPTLGVAIMSWLLGTAGAIVTLVLLRRATTDQHGPFSKYMYRAAGGANAGAPPQAGATPAVGTV